LERQSAQTLYVQNGSVWTVHAENDVAVRSTMGHVFVSEDRRAFIEGSHKAFVRARSTE